MSSLYERWYDPPPQVCLNENIGKNTDRTNYYQSNVFLVMSSNEAQTRFETVKEGFKTFPSWITQRRSRHLAIQLNLKCELNDQKLLKPRGRPLLAKTTIIWYF